MQNQFSEAQEAKTKLKSRKLNFGTRNLEGPRTFGMTILKPGNFKNEKSEG